MVFFFLFAFLFHLPTFANQVKASPHLVRLLVQKLLELLQQHESYRRNRTFGRLCLDWKRFWKNRVRWQLNLRISFSLFGFLQASVVAKVFKLLWVTQLSEICVVVLQFLELLRRPGSRTLIFLLVKEGQLVEVGFGEFFLVIFQGTDFAHWSLSGGLVVLVPWLLLVLVLSILLLSVRQLSLLQSIRLYFLQLEHSQLQFAAIFGFLLGLSILSLVVQLARLLLVHTLLFLFLVRGLQLRWSFSQGLSVSFLQFWAGLQFRRVDATPDSVRGWAFARVNFRAARLFVVWLDDVVARRVLFVRGAV